MRFEDLDVWKEMTGSRYKDQGARSKEER